MTDTDNTTATTDQRLRLPALVAYRAAAMKRRAAAFCDAPEYVLGTEVLPLTPRTCSMLVAVGSHFLVGGKPTEGDVRNYIWFHSRHYAHAGVKNWRRRKRLALRSLLRALYNPGHHYFKLPVDKTRYSIAMVLAITEIGALISEAFADCPAASGTGQPVATIEAQMIDHFATVYHWAPERTRNTPIRQLFQLIRCARASRGEDIRDRGEEEILVQHIRARHAALAAQTKGEAP